LQNYSNPVYRIIDANINRIKEGLRVLEEITRFIFNNRAVTTEFKKIRHKVDAAVKNIPHSKLLKDRNALNDVGKNIFINELKRESVNDIFFANIQRIKESARVLEEFSKLLKKNYSVKFKRIRYHIYELEKKAFKQIPALRNHR
jgi:thiamine-phosphate pyrophosphorylase